METDSYTLIVVISNMILTPFFNYLLHSRCTKIDMCCLHCKREIMENDEQV